MTDVVAAKTLSTKGAVREKVTIPIPEGLTASYEGITLTINGPAGQAARKIAAHGIAVALEDNKVVLQTSRSTKKTGKLINTLKAHIANMVKGCTEGHIYKLKAVYTHFPLSASVSGKEFIIKNLFGEKVPRKLHVPHGVQITVSPAGTEISVQGADKEMVAQIAASIEQLTRRSAFDRRVFMDGIYITSKDGKEIK